MAPFTFRNTDCGVMEKVWVLEAERYEVCDLLYALHKVFLFFLIFFFWLNLITASSHINDMRGTQGKGTVALFQSHHK